MRTEYIGHECDHFGRRHTSPFWDWPSGSTQNEKGKKNGNNEEELKKTNNRGVGKQRKQREHQNNKKKTKYQTTGNWGYRSSGLSRPEKHRGGCA